MNDCSLEADEIDEVLLVGGTTRIPKVKEKLKRIFRDIELNESLPKDEAVAMGAAIQAGMIEASNYVGGGH